jgi:hypothetical protein
MAAPAQASQGQQGQMNYMNSIVEIMKRLKEAVVDPNRSLTIKPDGSFTETYKPEVANVLSAAAGQGGGPAIGQGVIDPQLISQMGGQLMGNQQQQQNFAASIPELISNMAYKGALTGQVADSNQQSMDQLILGMAGRLMEQQMSGQQAMERHQTPKAMGPLEEDYTKAQIRAANALADSRMTGPQITPFQKETLAAKSAKQESELSQKAGEALSDFEKGGGKEALIQANNFYQSYPLHPIIPIMKIVDWGADIKDIVNIAPYTAKVVGLLANASGMTPLQYATSAYEQAKSRGLETRDVIGSDYRRLTNAQQENSRDY